MNFVLAQVDDCEGGRVLEVRGFNQGEELHPVAALKGLLVQLLGEVYDNGGLFDLSLDLLGQRLALLQNVGIVRQPLLEVCDDLGDRPLNHVEVKLEEGSLVAESLSLLPEKQVLP